MISAAAGMGIPAFENPNGAMMEGRGGAALNDLIVKDGRRNSIYRAYVAPRCGQPNLTVLTDTLVSRVLFRDQRAIGVQTIKDGQIECFYADHEVILSLGAVNTPKVLMQSGVGPEEELQRHGIPLVQHLPGVGANHQDHVSFAVIFEYAAPQPVGYGGSEALCISPICSTAKLNFQCPAQRTPHSAFPHMAGQCSLALPIRKVAAGSSSAARM